jgi:hypothetical protein
MEVPWGQIDEKYPKFSRRHSLDQTLRSFLFGSAKEVFDKHGEVGNSGNKL